MKTNTLLFYLLIAAFVFFSSCKENLDMSEEAINSQEISSTRTNALSLYDSIGLQLYNRLGDFHVFPNKDGQVLNFFYDAAFTNNGVVNNFPEKADFLHQVQTNFEMILYLPYSTYLDIKEEEAIISPTQKDYLLHWEATLSQLDAALASRQNYLNTINSFELELIQDASLSLEEKAILRSFLVTFKYGMQYLFDHGLPTSGGEMAHFRSCNLDNITQIFRGYTAIVDFFTLLIQAPNSSPEVILANLEATVTNVGGFIFGLGNWIECILIDSHIIPVEILIDFWCWISSNCEDEIDCHDPENIAITSRTGCRSADIRVFGSGNDISTYQWVNTNATPVAAATSIPELNITAVSPTAPVMITVTPICVDGTVQTPITRSFILDVGSIPTAPNVNINGETTVNTYTTNTYTAIYSIHPIIELNWTVDSSIGEIISSDNNTVDVRFFRAGIADLTATVSNICSTQSNSTTLQITVH